MHPSFSVHCNGGAGGTCCLLCWPLLPGGLWASRELRVHWQPSVLTLCAGGLASACCLCRLSKHIEFALFQGSFSRPTCREMQGTVGYWACKNCFQTWEKLRALLVKPSSTGIFGWLLLQRWDTGWQGLLAWSRRGSVSSCNRTALTWGKMMD